MIVGLGNGTLLKLKRKKLKLDEMHQDIHKNQITQILTDDKNIVTLSTDMSISWHELQTK